ncbi:MAG: Ni/Fe hydrogenase subunit alpha [Deltaproteobacteria bacterium]|nr:Ni/Fe hydrogenase subunit alpha [Deltaproteobacteria bacterium]MBI3294255.1 Ni/Fe hydrogenase subunit alpha [Deltaproteobacteria bacterium]
MSKKEEKKPTKRTIQVKYLARVEGEGGLDVTVEGKKVKELALRIFEPPRFFEAFLRGRKYQEAPDITSRICGICPVAYQMSAVSAMESALHLKPENSIQQLRRMLYCGEWIESHTLHIYLLHAPDFLGFEGAIEMAKKFPEIVKRGLGLKKTGNSLMALLGGREIHPINVRVGGFYRAPSKQELSALVPELSSARAAAEETVHWVSKFSFPEYERDYEFVSLRSSDSVYPIERGQVVSTSGLSFSASEFDDFIKEEQVPHSTALHARLKGKPYLVGPLARFNLNFDRLSPSTRKLAKDIGFVPPINNPFKSIIARSLEVHYACDEALRIIFSYEKPNEPYSEATPRTSVGFGLTEAPRGLLYHQYKLDKDGIIEAAQIVPPTSQNLMTIEEDLKSFIEENSELSQKELGWRCEQLIRNYDPCISCSAHFLKVKWEEL